MKPSRLPVLVLIALSSAARVRGAEVVVRPERAVIVLPAEADAVKKTAAEELRQHFKLVTGADLPLIAQGDALDGRYPFRVGLPAPNDVQPLAPEEARWAVTAEATDLYGQDQGACGTQFAVYGFLEDQLGVRWIRPGDEGIGFQPRAELRLTVGRSSWAPHLEFRKIRPDVRPGRGQFICQDGALHRDAARPRGKGAEDGDPGPGERCVHSVLPVPAITSEMKKRRLPVGVSGISATKASSK